MMKHLWRDIGGGKIQCENTKRVMSLREARGVPDTGHTIKLTDAQWARLSELAAHRSKTPQQCIVDFIHSCVAEDMWKHPTTATVHHANSKG